MSSMHGFLYFIAHHVDLAYGAVFLVALSESLAFVGLIVPGSMVMFGVGAIVATGSLRFLPTCAIAALGAIAGDGISFWLGHRYREGLRTVWPLRRYPRMLARGEAFFQRHGGKSIIFGRFVGPVRPVLPLVAGMLGMEPLQFVVVNVLSGMGWAVVYLLPGFFFGTSLSLAGMVSARLTVLILLIAISVWAFVWSCRRIIRFLGDHGPRWLAALERWISEAKPARGWRRPVKRFFSFFFMRPKGEEYLLGLLFFLLIVAVWGFFRVLQGVLARDPLVMADQAVYHFFLSIRTPWADHILVAVTEMGDFLVYGWVAIAVLLLFLVKRCTRTAGYWALAIFGGLLVANLLKWMLHLPRPVALYHGVSAYGFPSQHSTMIVIVYGFLAILIARGSASARLRAGLITAVLMVSFLVAFSRLYLGAHWLSDVLGGFFVGTIWTVLLAIAYLKGPVEPIPRRWLALVTIGVLACAGTWHLAEHHQRDLAFFSPRHIVKPLTFKHWVDDGWRRLPAWRFDFEGERKQPLTIQWAGSVDALTNALISEGWHRPVAFGLHSVFALLSPETPIAQLPVFPHLHDGRMEKVLLVQVEGDRKRVLRLWPTDVRIVDGGSFPLWIGSVETQIKAGYVHLITMPISDGDYVTPLQQLESGLEKNFKVRRVVRSIPSTGRHWKKRRIHWEGEVLLIMESAPVPNARKKLKKKPSP